MPGLLIVAIAGAALLVAALRLSELWRRRENEAAALQARIMSALLMDPRLRPEPLTPIVQPGFWPCSRLTVVLVGQATDEDLHARARALMARHLRARHCRYEDRVVVHAVVHAPAEEPAELSQAA